MDDFRSDDDKQVEMDTYMEGDDCDSTERVRVTAKMRPAELSV